jgi:hypothetical protein
MKLGTENKKKTILAASALGVGILFLLWSLLGSSRRTPAPSTPAAGGTAPRTAVVATGAAEMPSSHSIKRRYPGISLAQTLDPRLRLDLLQDTEGMRYEGKGRNVFQEQLEDIPQAKYPGSTDMGGKGPKPPRPPWPVPTPVPPPPINLKFYGWASQPGEPKAIFLTQGENAYVAHEGDIVARRYKVLKIGDKAVEVEDMLNNHRQSIPLGT